MGMPKVDVAASEQAKLAREHRSELKDEGWYRVIFDGLQVEKESNSIFRSDSKGTQYATLRFRVVGMTKKENGKVSLVMNPKTGKPVMANAVLFMRCDINPEWRTLYRFVVRFNSEPMTEDAITTKFNSFKDEASFEKWLRLMAGDTVTSVYVTNDGSFNNTRWSPPQA